jgi:aminoglycoside 6'-N-acetyltransferase
LREPDVAIRWGEFEDGQIEKEFVQVEKVFVIEVDGEVIGVIQYREEEDPMCRHANIDAFLTTSRHGRGTRPERRPLCCSRRCPLESAGPSSADAA